LLGRFFVDRPVFASVIAIVIVLMGGLALSELPIAQYPNVAPPRVYIEAFYPGASAETVETSVTQILEQQLKGIDGMLYFSSASDAAGNTQIEVTFHQGVNADIAQMQVQNKLQLALSRLPLQVQQQGLFVSKAQNDFLMVVALLDPHDRLQSADIADFLVSSLRDPISRIDGVGNINVFGSQYAMRVWLDPYKLAAYQLMPSDVDAAIKAQNTQLAAGELGAQPALSDQQLNATVVAQSRLQTPDEFRQIVLKTQPDGSRVLLRDVARIELGSESYDAVTGLDGHPASGMAIMLASGANALATARAVKARIAELQSAFPRGVIAKYPNDTTRFCARQDARSLDACERIRGTSSRRLAAPLGCASHVHSSRNTRGRARRCPRSFRKVKRMPLAAASHTISHGASCFCTRACAAWSASRSAITATCVARSRT
jgi:multidrug efflux pump